MSVFLRGTPVEQPYNPEKVYGTQENCKFSPLFAASAKYSALLSFHTAG